MTDFGVTPDGFLAPTLREIEQDIADDQHAEIDPNLDTSTTAPDGQRNAITARQLALAWEAEAEIYEALDPDKAEDDQLINLCKLTGTVPRAAGYSLVKCTIVADVGTVLTPSVAFAAVLGKPDVLFTPAVEFTAPSTGTHTNVKWKAVTAGPVQAFATTLTVINTAIPGWTSITNPLDATEGAAADTNETLRLRREAELARAGSSTVRAIEADLLELADADGNKNIQTCQVLENVTDVIDANGLLPHSIEPIVYDLPAFDNNLIAQAIFDGIEIAGIRTLGNTSGTAVDEQGTEYAIAFSRPSEQAVYLIYDLTTSSQYPGDVAFKETVATALRALHVPGASVLRAIAEREAWKVAGITNVVSVKLGFAPAPALSADLAITPRQVATFDTTRISRT